MIYPTRWIVGCCIGPNFLLEQYSLTFLQKCRGICLQQTEPARQYKDTLIFSTWVLSVEPMGFINVTEICQTLKPTDRAYQCNALTMRYRFAQLEPISKSLSIQSTLLGGPTFRPFWRANCPGGSPVWRENAMLKALADP